MGRLWRRLRRGMSSVRIDNGHLCCLGVMRLARASSVREMKFACTSFGWLDIGAMQIFFSFELHRLVCMMGRLVEEGLNCFDRMHKMLYSSLARRSPLARRHLPRPNGVVYNVSVLCSPCFQRLYRLHFEVACEYPPSCFKRGLNLVLFGRDLLVRISSLSFGFR